MSDTSLCNKIQPLPINLSSDSLVSNFFKPAFNSSQCLHIYSATFTPEVVQDSRRLRYRLFHTVEEQLVQVLGAHVASGLNLFAIKEVSEPIVMEVDYEDTRYTLTLNFTHKVDMAHATEQMCLVLNVILKKVLKALGLKQVTRLPKFYDEQHTQTIPELGLEIWRGYIAQISLLSNIPLLNIDFSSKIIHTRTFLDELCEYRNLGGDWKQVASTHLENRIVMAKYGNRRCYKVDEIVYDKTPQDHLSPTDTRSFIDYFAQQYEEHILHPSQPLIRSHNRRSGEETDLYLVPELVSLTGLDQEMRANYKTMNTIAASTRLEPEERLQVSTTLSNLINTRKEAQTIMNNFQLEVDPVPMMVNAYDISGECVFTDGQTMHPVDETGNFNMRGGGVLSSVQLTNWVIVAPQSEQEPAQNFISALYSRLCEINSETVQPQIYTYSNTTPVESVVPNILKNSEIQFMVVLWTRRLKDRYPKLKKFTSTLYCVPSQVVVIPLAEKRARSIIDKVALQIQAKLGAQLWTVKPSTNFGKYVMVVGIDIFHDLLNRKKSVLGFCATVHPNFSKYYSTTSMQETGQEIATAIGQLFVEAVNVFKEKAKRYPETIIFFRDGVAESQTESVRQFEVESILRSCERVEKGYVPEVIYTVVIKKTNAKFFATTHGRVKNPHPGTLVTSTVVPNTGDFYLISHSANQGISSPSLYRTLYASKPENFPLESLARLAYKLCHMYYNWSGAVKVPAPCMMAHKIAYYVGQCVHEAVNQSIRTLAFYL